MALFSRRPKKPADTPADETRSVEPEQRADAEQADAAAPAPADAEAAANEADAPEAPSVSISVSSFGGLGAAPAAPAATPPAAAPGAPAAGGSGEGAGRPLPGIRAATQFAPKVTESLPGLRDNTLLSQALAAMANGPASQTLLQVARQMLQGHVFLRVKGDARQLLAEGKQLPLAVATAGERTFALAYSSGFALQASVRADGDAGTSAMSQPVMAVLRHVLGGSYAGIILDPASAPARAVLPRELLEKMVEQADPELRIKTLLAGERTPITATEVAEALTQARLWVAVRALEGGRTGLAEGRLADGSRYLEVYSHPLEIAGMGRGDNAAPLTGEQLARALRTDTGLSGVVVDPAGPWIRLTRDELGPVLAL